MQEQIANLRLCEEIQQMKSNENFHILRVEYSTRWKLYQGKHEEKLTKSVVCYSVSASVCVCVRS